ncbi:MAG: HAMP domain-containing sensor histidine kinase, partial [Actinomycetota bacterium]
GIAVVALLVFQSADTELAAETDDFLERRAEDLIEGRREPSRDRGGRREPPQPDEVEISSPFDPDAIVQTLDESGQITASSTSDVVLPVSAIDVSIAQALDGKNDGTSSRKDMFRDVTIDGVDYRLYTEAIPGGGAVQVARSVEETTRVLDSLQNRVIAIGLAMSALAAVIGSLVARQTTRPLRRLAATATTVADTHDLATPIEVDRSDEVGALARSFKEMLDALAASREQQHRLVHDAGHELRTPLTSLRANVSLLERADRLEPEDRAEVLASVKAELGELNELFGELIELATDNQHAEPFVRLELGSVAERAVDRLARRTDRPVSVHADTSVVQGDATLLERAISNLLGNAHKFSPPGTPIEVVVDQGRVAVRDHGPGIAPGDRERVFDRFHRSDATRTMPGSGLGLAIVDQIVKTHGGTVWATDSPSTPGAEVGFAIPLGG